MIIDSFKDMELYENEGNIFFPEGNAKKYLSEYFTSTVPNNPYIKTPYDVRCISFDPKGNVLNGAIYAVARTDAGYDIYQIVAG